MDMKKILTVAAALAFAGAYAAGPGGQSGGPGGQGGPGGDQGGGGAPGGGSLTYDSFMSVTTNAYCLVREGTLFAYTSSLTTSVAPAASAGVTALAHGVFAGNTAITTVNLSNTSITEVPSDAFVGCTALKSVVLPATCTAIGANAFAGCTALSTLTASGATTVGADAFRGCSSLAAVPASATSLGAYSFSQSGVTAADISAVSVGEGVFAGCKSLASATAGEELPAAAFAGCTALTASDWSGVATIGRAALAGIPATTLTLADGVSLGAYAFAAAEATLATTLSNATVPECDDTAFLGRELSYTPVAGSVARAEAADLVDWLLSGAEQAGVTLPADYNTATLETWLAAPGNAQAYAYAAEIAENPSFLPLAVEGETFSWILPSSTTLCVGVEIVGSYTLSADESDWTADALVWSDEAQGYVAAEEASSCFARLRFTTAW